MENLNSVTISTLIALITTAIAIISFVNKRYNEMVTKVIDQESLKKDMQRLEEKVLDLKEYMNNNEKKLEDKMDSLSLKFDAMNENLFKLASGTL